MTGKDLERMTVNLIPDSAEARKRAAELTGDSETDTVNRALQVYAHLVEVTRENGKIYVRTEPGADLEELRFF